MFNSDKKTVTQFKCSVLSHYISRTILEQQYCGICKTISNSIPITATMYLPNSIGDSSVARRTSSRSSGECYSRRDWENPHAFHEYGIRVL